MKKIFYFVITILITIAFVILYMKATEEKLQNPEFIKVREKLNGHYVIGQDSLKFENGEIYDKKGNNN